MVLINTNYVKVHLYLLFCPGEMRPGLRVDVHDLLRFKELNLWCVSDPKLMTLENFRCATFPKDRDKRIVFFRLGFQIFGNGRTGNQTSHPQKDFLILFSKQPYLHLNFWKFTFCSSLPTACPATITFTIAQLIWL